MDAFQADVMRSLNSRPRKRGSKNNAPAFVFDVQPKRVPSTHRIWNTDKTHEKRHDITGKIIHVMHPMFIFMSCMSVYFVCQIGCGHQIIQQKFALRCVALFRKTVRWGAPGSHNVSTTVTIFVLWSFWGKAWYETFLEAPNWIFTAYYRSNKITTYWWKHW